MKTTIDIQDELLARAELRAKQTGLPLQALIEEGLRCVLAVPSPADRETFRRLADQWEEGTAFMSNFNQIAAHPAYREIISMGAPAVPLILERLAERGGHWFAALRTLTAADPIAPEDRGKVAKMRAAWLDWGQRNGYA